MKACIPRSEAKDSVLSNRPEYASLFAQRPLSGAESVPVALPTAAPTQPDAASVAFSAACLAPSLSASLHPACG